MATLRPNDYVALVAACVVEALTARPTGWTGRVVRGYDGAGESQPCCPSGLLRVEWSATDRGNVIGTSQCRHRGYLEVHAIVRRCVSAFEIGPGGASDGSAPAVAVVEAESNLIMDDAWTVWEALSCCALDWQATVEDQSFVNIGTCKGSDTRMRIPCAVCCSS